MHQNKFLCQKTFLRISSHHKAPMVLDTYTNYMVIFFHLQINPRKFERATLRYYNKMNFSEGNYLSSHKRFQFEMHIPRLFVDSDQNHLYQDKAFSQVNSLYYLS